MRLPETNLRYAALLFLLALLFGVSEAMAAQQSKAQRAPEDKLLDTKVSEFELQNQTLADGLWKLARAPAPFAFGLEKVLKKRLADPEIQDPSFSLQLKNNTVRESGINNAVARLAGVLAIAVFGIVMIKVFDRRLDHRLANLNLPVNIVQDLRSREIELAGLQPPRSLDMDTVAAIRHAISESFISGFRVVLFCCAGLSIGSALIAWGLLNPRGSRPSP
jgi:hypothetical protein